VASAVEVMAVLLARLRVSQYPELHQNVRLLPRIALSEGAMAKEE
jgi:hypothetical protein